MTLKQVSSGSSHPDTLNVLVNGLSSLYLPDIFPKRYLPDLSLSPTPGPPPPTHLGGGGDDHHAGGGISGWTAGLRDSSPSLLYRDSCTGISKLQGPG